MPNRRLWITFFALSALCHELAVAEASPLVPLPEIKVGDQWKLDTRDLYNNQLKSSSYMVVTAVSATRLDFDADGTTGFMTPALTVLDSPTATNDTGYEFLRFPLEVGKKWDFKTQWRNKRSGATGKSEFEVTVVGSESVTVAAGAFDAIKLRAIGQMSMASGYWKVTLLYWYAPQARQIVRFEWRDHKRDLDHLRELVEYKLTP